MIVTTSTQALTLGIVKFALLVIVYLAIVIGVVFEQSAERRVPIQYANRSVNSVGAKNSYIPFKLNSAGVVPVIRICITFNTCNNCTVCEKRWIYIICK